MIKLPELYPILEGDVLHMVDYKAYNETYGTPYYYYDADAEGKSLEYTRHNLT